MKYLLDTNVCISYLRGAPQSIRTKLESLSPAEVAICATVRSELLFGVLRLGSPARQRQALDDFQEPITCLPLDEEVADVCAQIRCDLAADGLSIGPYDLQIAATAVHHGLILVTHNTKEFARVKDLQYEDWEAS